MVMNWQGFGRKWLPPNLDTIPAFASRGMEHTKKNLGQDIRCPDRVSNRVPSEYKSGTLPLDQQVRYVYLRHCLTSYRVVTATVVKRLIGCQKLSSNSE
jgi:hypothetical protein